MSIYHKLWYQGIVKPEFRTQVQEVFRNGRWKCGSPPLGGLLHLLFPDDSDAPWLHMLGEEEHFPPEWTSPEYGNAPSCDPETGLLRFGSEWNYRQGWRFERLEEWVLPYLTERLISYHRWHEPVLDTDTGEIEDRAEQFRLRQELLAEQLGTRSIEDHLSELLEEIG